MKRIGFDYSVDASGLVVAKAPGTACIRAKLNGKTAVVHITVKAIQVSLDKTSITLYLGYKDKLNVSYEPSGTPSWSSEDSKIVSVDQNGTLTPVSVGQTIARVKVNGKTAEAKVVVKQPFVKSPSKTKTKRTITRSFCSSSHNSACNFRVPKIKSAL